LRVKLTALTSTNLGDIGDHYSHVGGHQLAYRMVGKIKFEVMALANYPESAPPHALVPGVRRLVVAGGAYLVFYRVADTVQILHVRRAERTLATAEDVNSDDQV
jgi:plasmid stabilization system protein ParE